METKIYKKLKKNWIELIHKAEKQITIFTPYFDEILIEILSENNKEEVRKIVITDFNPIYFIQNIKQLYSLKKLLSLGIEVLHYKDLHAKVLIIDNGKYFTIGC